MRRSAETPLRQRDLKEDLKPCFSWGLCAFVVQETKQFDFLVLGGGIAGLSFALQVASCGRVATARDFYFTRAMSGMVWRSKRR
jgi:hypothetical protein